ncbi:DUF6124 family protein [Pseudomonas syringae]|uniref:DUF6124 family protein n=1 Tax=Pseudomonas syringae TaxID=317 RepID=UPI00068677DC|nr:hypothetical protein [Pseudomonas syringae]
MRISEDAIMHASELLRCAMTSAAEFSDSMTGTQRDMTLSIMHLMEMAKVILDWAIDKSGTE